MGYIGVFIGILKGETVANGWKKLKKHIPPDGGFYIYIYIYNIYILWHFPNLWDFHCHVTWDWKIYNTELNG